MLPFAPAVDWGVNCTLNVADVFGAIVAGIDRPLMLNPVPETAAALTAKFMLPVLLSVTLCVLVWPTLTLLKFSDDGEKAGTASRPVPLSATARLEFVASLVTVNAPVAGVIEVGANRICTVAVCPTASELDGVALTTVNTSLETVAPEIFTAPVPVFVMVTLCIAVVPTATFP